MDKPIPANRVCPHCDTVLSVDNDSCPACGNGEAHKSQIPIPWDENSTLIICTMVFAALFLGFPLLWRSRQFSLLAKIVWTVLVTLETILIFWLFFWLLSTHMLPKIFEALDY